MPVIDMSAFGRHPEAAMTNCRTQISRLCASGAALSAAVYYYYGTARAGPI
jgi:hypothetical protein